MKESSYWGRRGSASRRSFLTTTGGASAGLAALALAGCGDDDSPPTSVGTATSAAASSPAAAQPKRGGTDITAQTTASNDVMDPHTSLNQAGVLWSYIGNTPLRTTRDLKNLESELVEKWEIPGDGSEMLLTIRQGVVWQNRPPTNGRAFVADDLAFSLTRITGKLNPEKLAAFQRASTLPNFESATAVDEKTVRVKLTAPHSSFINGLAEWRNSIVPRDFVEKGGKFEEPATMVGTGPWILEQWSPGVKGVYKANPTFWQKGKPYLDGIEYAFYGDRLSSLTAFAQGKFDYLSSPTKPERDSLNKLGAKFREETGISGNWNHFRFNTTRKPFTDARVRRALHLALDYKAINDGYYPSNEWEYTGALTSVFPEAFSSAEISKMPGFNPATKQADIKAAKDLMSAAGYPDGAISFKLMPYQNINSFYENAIRAVDQWKAVWPAMNIDIDLPSDTTVFSRRQVASDFDMLTYIIAPGSDAQIELSTQVYSKGSRNYGKFNDARIDQLLDKATTQLDTKQRGETLKEAQRSLLDTHMPLLYVNVYAYVFFFLNKVKGMEKFITPLGSGTYDAQRYTKDMWFDA